MRGSNSTAIATLVFVLVAMLAVPSAALADKKKPKATNDTPTESLSLSYGQIKYDYKAQDARQNTNHPTPKSGASGNMRR